MDTGAVVIEPSIDAGSMTDDQILAFTQRIRVDQVNHILKTKPGGVIECKEDREYLIKNIEGLDKVALVRKRIAADKEAATGVSQAVGLISALLRQSKTTYNTTDVVDVSAPAPKLSSDIPEPDLVPGETEINAGQLSYDEFVAGKQPASK